MTPLTKEFSPHMLRFSIEIELQSTNDPKIAAMIAISRLRKDPDYYTNKYGFVEPAKKAKDMPDKNIENLVKAKYIKRTGYPGHYRYFYPEDVKDKTAGKVEEKEKEKSVNQTDTSEFKKWFGDSKVVDKDGKPLVVYHGTDKDFKEFDINKTGQNSDTGMWGKGFYFSDDTEYASHYAKKESGNVKPVFLSIKNPLVIRSKEDIPKINVPMETIEDMKNADSNYSKIFTEYAKNKGHDGIIVDMKGTKEIVAFSPTQIKSATGNRGTFDPNESDMTKATRSGTHKYIKKIMVGVKPRYFYTEQEVKETKGTIEIKSISAIKGIFDFFRVVGFYPLIGEQKISKQSNIKSFEITENIKNIKTNEIGYSINSDGLIIFKKKGSIDNIELTEEDAKMIKNTEIFIHNHTQDKTLSCNDIMIAASLGIKRISAVFENKKYSMDISLKNDIENNQELTEKMFLLANGLAFSFLESKKELFEDIKNNKLTLAQANIKESNLIMDKILSNENINSLFSIKYTKE